MNTHDIELPQGYDASPWDYDGQMYTEGQIRAAIEADRKRTADLLKNPIHVHSNMCRGIIAPITFDMLAHVLGEEATNEWLRKRMGEPIANLWVNPETLEFEVDNCNHPIDELIPVYEAPQPPEPGSTHHVHRGTESLPCYCNGTYDHPIGKETLEPVKVPSDADAKHIQDFIACDGMGAVIVEGPQYSAVVRALLARYSHLTAPTHKSSNQNRLIEDLKLVYGDNKPIATVITHNNHKLLSFDPGALDELPEGTILYAKK